MDKIEAICRAIEPFRVVAQRISQETEEKQKEFVNSALAGCLIELLKFRPLYKKVWDANLDDLNASSFLANFSKKIEETIAYKCLSRGPGFFEIKTRGDDPVLDDVLLYLRSLYTANMDEKTNVIVEKKVKKKYWNFNGAVQTALEGHKRTKSGKDNYYKYANYKTLFDSLLESLPRKLGRKFNSMDVNSRELEWKKIIEKVTSCFLDSFIWLTTKTEVRVALMAVYTPFMEELFKEQRKRMVPVRSRVNLDSGFLISLDRGMMQEKYEPFMDSSPRTPRRDLATTPPTKQLRKKLKVEKETKPNEDIFEFDFSPEPVVTLKHKIIAKEVRAESPKNLPTLSKKGKKGKKGQKRKKNYNTQRQDDGRRTLRQNKPSYGTAQIFHPSRTPQKRQKRSLPSVDILLGSQRNKVARR